MKGLAGGAAAGSAECWKQWTTALIHRLAKVLIPRIRSELRRHSRYAPTSQPGSTGERQEHLDAIITFASAGQRRRLFRILDIFTVKWASGNIPEECRVLLNAQLMFFFK